LSAEESLPPASVKSRRLIPATTEKASHLGGSAYKIHNLNAFPDFASIAAFAETHCLSNK
jgi:hypothetical protein